MIQFVNNLKKYTASIEPWWTIILVPIFQEFLFRYLPFRFLYLPTGNFWLIGITISLFFASIHWYFGKWFVMYAFVGGMVLWWVMVNYGLIAAIFVHAIINVLDLVFGLRKFLIK